MIIGIGGHGRETLDIVEAVNAVTPIYDFLAGGVAHSDEVGPTQRSGDGTSADIAGLAARYLLGIGDGKARANVRSGQHSHLSLNATIAHDYRVGSYVTILPGVRVGEHSILGAGAVVIEGRSAWCDSGRSACPSDQRR